MNELKELFERMTVDSLSYVSKGLGIKATSKIKADKIQMLLNYYSDKECIKKIWESLDAYEKELLTCIVQSDYHPHNDDLEKISKKHSVKFDNRLYSGRSQDSKLNTIIIAGQTPKSIRSDLSKLVPKYKPEFKIRKDVNTDGYEGRIIDRANRYSDFDMLLFQIYKHEI